MRILSILALGGLAAACVTSPARAQPRTIAIDGSSTVFPIMEAVAEEFQKSKRGQVRVTVGISGTGGGFKKFCRGETDVSNGSRPILQEELEACRRAGVAFYELPIAFDALTVVVNPRNTWVECITIAELKRMWEPAAQGKVTTWKQINETWPDRPLRLYGAGSDSGTFDYFTEATVGKAKASRGDYTASEDDNVLVKGVETDEAALGYFGYAYYAAAPAGRMKALAIDWGKGQGCVKPDVATVVAGTYNPLSRPLFLYVSKKSVGKPEVKEFVEFALAEAPALVKEVRYVPLPETAYVATRARVAKGELGTAFGGIPDVGLHIDEILQKRPVL